MKTHKNLQINESYTICNMEFSQDAIILDLFSLNSNCDEDFEIDTTRLNSLLCNVKQSGSFWIIASHIKLNDQTKPLGFELAGYIINQGWFLRNIITWFIPNNKNHSEKLTNRYAHIYFFVKSLNNYYFNKDLIREKHIWKGIEWGNRPDRYHPLGKDPGNVWLMTEDDGKGKKTKHVPLSFDMVINRIKLATCPKDGNLILYSNRATTANKVNILPINDFIKNKTKQKVPNLKMTSSIKTNTRQKPTYKVINRTSEKMIDLRNEEVDLIVTSPPYWDMKNYCVKDQIGYTESYELYLSRIKKVFRECYKVLNKKGTFWLNINTKMYNKSLRMIPYDFYKQCIEIGFKLWDIVIWHKSVSGPVPDNNLTDKFEYVLVFYKKAGFYFNKEFESKKCDYLVHNLKSMGNIWNINRFWGTIGKNYPHPAMYPDELVERILNIGSVEGDLVLDPFLGSGTTLVVAKKLLRSCVGYEINSDYFAILNKRLLEEKLEDLFNQDQKVQFVA